MDRTLTAVLVVATLSHATAQAETFGWRGNGTGVIRDATPPIEWSEKTNLLWRAEVGSGYACPIAVSNSVIVASEPDVLVCVDAASGTIRWKQSAKAADLPEEMRGKVRDLFGPGTSGNAAAAPVSDGELVYQVFGNGIVVACELATGTRRWTRHIDTDPRSMEGRSASPLLCDGKLIVHLTELFALDPRNGQILWRQPDAMDAYGSPVAAKAAGTELIVTPAGSVVRAADGAMLAHDLGYLSFGSPVVDGDTVYFVDAAAAAVRLAGRVENGRIETTETWTDSAAGEIYCSPIVANGRVYVVTTGGALYVFDVAAKKRFERWLDFVPAEDQVPAGGMSSISADPERAVWGSLTLAGKNLFITTNDGRSVVLEPGPEAKTVQTNALPAGSPATPAFAGSRIFFRGGEFLYCVGAPQGSR